MTTNLPTVYPALLDEIKQRIRAAQYEALKAVNKELIALYWDIGRLIIERQTGETWGKSVVSNLANDLQKEFPGISGFSVSNLWRMRLFYTAYADNENSHQWCEKLAGQKTSSFLKSARMIWSVSFTYA